MKLPSISYDSNSHSRNTLIRLLDAVQISCLPGEAVMEDSHSFYCLLYIQSGSALFPSLPSRITESKDGKTAVLPTGSLLFLSCKDRLRFRAMDSGLEAWAFYFDGDALPFYYDMITNHFTNVLTLLPGSSLLPHICAFIQLKRSRSLTEEFFCNEHMTNLLSEYMVREDSSPRIPKIPAYLFRVKEEFDLHYSGTFCLEDLAASHKTSKYQLCRDFSKHYGFSPIKYLNQVRIQNACTLLAAGEMSVGEIGIAVGIENTNHFIRLFKAQMGITPLQYRNSILT